MMLRHEATNTGDRTVLSQPYNLTSFLDTVIFKCLKWDRLMGALHFLWLGVHLLLPLLSSSAET